MYLCHLTLTIAYNTTNGYNSYHIHYQEFLSTRFCPVLGRFLLGSTWFLYAGVNVITPARGLNLGPQGTHTKSNF